jgi:hypothetical protein
MRRAQTNASVNPSPVQTLLAKTIESRRSKFEDNSQHTFYLICLAATSMANAAWSGKLDPGRNETIEQTFEFTVRMARSILKERVGGLQANLSEAKV